MNYCWILFLIPGDIDDDDALFAAHEEEEFEEAGTLVVEEVLPPVVDDELGDEDGDVAILVDALFGEDVFEHGHEDSAVGGFEALEFGIGEAGLAEGGEDLVDPDGRQLLRAVVGVGGVDMDDLELVGDRHGEAEGLGGDAAPAIHGDDDDGGLDVGDLEGLGAGGFF